jgi:membrane associated rhomboid family serine protease
VALKPLMELFNCYLSFFKNDVARQKILTMEKLKGTIPVLIIINVIFFAITEAIPDMRDTMFHAFALYFPQNPHFGYWQFITNMFMHGSIAHILFNMYGLWAFGTPLEQMWGKNKFLFFYFLSGIGAGIVYTLVNYFQFNNLYNEFVASGVSSEDIKRLTETGEYDTTAFSAFSKEKLESIYMFFNTPVVGASGAIYGVLVAFGMLFPNSKLMLIFLPFPIAAKYFIPALIALDLFSGVTGFSIFGGGIAHFGHIGGALIGFLLMLYWRNRAKKEAYPYVGQDHDVIT